METSIYKYIIKHTLRDQILILLITLVTFPLVYASLDIPKQIINKALSGNNIPEALFGYEVDQISYLLILCFIFLGLVIINGGLKYVLNVYRGVVGERMLRNLRMELYNRILRFPLPHFRKVSQGEIIPIITAETEPLGGFIGEAFALPAFQGGLLITYLIFIFNQDPFLGLAAIALYPLQMYVIPKLQRKVNELSKQRVLAARRLGDKVGDSIAGIQDIHSLGVTNYERTKIAGRLQNIFEIRFDIYKRKFFIKFLNNFLAKVTPFFFYSIGGYYVIQGELTLGALVAVLAAYQDLDTPWKELLKYYQSKEDVRIKYEQIVDQFTPSNMIPAQQLSGEPLTLNQNSQSIDLERVFFADDSSSTTLDNISVQLNLNKSIALIGDNNSGCSELAMLIARLYNPVRGRISLFGENLQQLNETTLSKHVSFVGPRAHLFAGTISDNILYTLNRPPLFEPEDDAIYKLQTDPLKHNLQGTPYSSADELQSEVLSLCKDFELDGDLYRFGLQQSMKEQDNPELAASLINLRLQLRSLLDDKNLSILIEFFNPDKYNTNLSVAENILFGSTTEQSLQITNLYSDPSLHQVLIDNDMMPTALELGYKVAETMIELFADLEPGSEIFERFSFISAEDIPEYQQLINQYSLDGLKKLPTEEKNKLLALFMMLTPAKHRLGLISEELQQKMVKVRKDFAQAQNQNRSLVHYQYDQFNQRLSIQENILFGKLAYGQANAQQKISEIIDRLIDENNLRSDIITFGLHYDVGTSGSRLQMPARQKLALIRALIRQPDLLIVDRATNTLDTDVEQRLIARMLKSARNKGVLWVISQSSTAELFDRQITMAAGEIINQTPP